MLISIGFIVFFEVDNERRDRDANRDDAARRSQGGCKAPAVIDFGPPGKYNIKELNLGTMYGRQWNLGTLKI